jgi:hypothetical protein
MPPGMTVARLSRAKQVGEKRIKLGVLSEFGLDPPIAVDRRRIAQMWFRLAMVHPVY